MFKAIRFLAFIMALIFVMPLANAAVVTCSGVPDSSSNCPLSIDDSGYVTFNGGVYAKYEAATTNDTITAAETGKVFIVTPSSPAIITLPTAAAGLRYRFVTGDQGVASKTLTINPQDADIIIWNNAVAGLTMAAGDAIKNSGLTGDSVELVAVGTGYWYAVDLRGTWPDAN